MIVTDAINSKAIPLITKKLWQINNGDKMGSQKIVNNPKEDREGWTSLVVQQLRLHASNAGDVGLIPGQGTNIPHAMLSQAKKKKDIEGDINSYYIK